MPYIGQDLQVAYPTYLNIDDISGSFDGVTTSFSLLVSGSAPVPLPLNSQQCLISVGGVIQRPDDSGTEGFRLSGGNIIFSSAPNTGEDFFGVILAGADYVNVGANFPDGSQAAPSITFEQDNDTGFYRSGSGLVSVSANNTKVFTFPSTAGSNGQYLQTDGAGTATWASVASDKISEGNTEAEVVDTGSNGHFKVTTEGSERLRVDPSGRLLVGTSSTFVSGANLQVAVNGGANTNRTDILCLVRTGGTGSASVEAGRSGWLTFGDTDNFTLTGGIGGYRVDPATYASGLRFAVWNGGGGQPATSAAGLQEAMRINDAGELLVGYTTDNGAYKLQVNSQIFATSATIATSDGRYKENVATLDGCLDLVKALRPVSFDWKPQQDITRTDEDGNEVLVREGHNFPDGTQVGFIAQEVQEVLAEKPWLTSVIKQNVRPAITDKDGNELAPEEEFLGIAEGNLIAVLTSALQEAIGEIESLKARVAALEAN